MTTVILILHIILAVAMIGMVLIQRNEGGALGLGGGTFGGLMTSRGTANLLTHVTAFLATSFFVTTLVLAVLFKGGQKTKSILDEDDSAKTVIEVPLATQKPFEKVTKPVVSQTPAKAASENNLQKNEKPVKSKKMTQKATPRSKTQKATTPLETSQ